MKFGADKQIGLLMADTLAIKFFPHRTPTAQSKSVAVAAIAPTDPHATPTHLLSPTESFKQKFTKPTNWILLILILVSNITFGQQWTLPIPKLPEYKVAGPTIINPGYNNVMTNEERNRINMQMIEQDMKNYELQKKREQEIINEANRLLGSRPTINYKYESNLNKPGALYYKQAFDSLAKMVRGQRPLNYKKAVFLSEWPFHEGTLTYKDFDQAIQNSLDLISAKMKQDKLPNTDLAKNWMIYQFMSDTLQIKLTVPEKRTVTHYPMQYDFEDFWGEKDWTKGMVSKLLRVQTGQCHSLPLLYLILSEGLGSKAYLAYSPEHSYIKIKMPNGTFQNIELTNGHLTTDSYILKSGFVKSEALANKVYMDTLSKRQVIANSILDLAKGYRNKYDFDEFYLECVNTALQYHPNNVVGHLMKGNYYYWLVQDILQQDPNINKRPTQEVPEFWDLVNKVKAEKAKLDALGYEQMPKEAYQDWLNSVEKEKSKQMQNVIQQSLWPVRK
jgi:hypothetical protein